ncbi:MAG: hypothetical protein AAFR87_34910, partial [Bacteroidota bacterium]
SLLGRGSVGIGQTSGFREQTIELPISISGQGAIRTTDFVVSNQALLRDLRSQSYMAVKNYFENN